MTFKRENLKDSLSFVANGEIHTFEYEMRPLSRGEVLMLGIQFPVVSAYFFGISPFPYTVKKENEQIVYDYSELERALDFIQQKAIVSMKIDGEKYEGDIKDLPDLLVVALLMKFKNFQFLAQGDVDFFAKINNYLNEFLQKQNDLE